MIKKAEELKKILGNKISVISIDKHKPIFHFYRFNDNGEVIAAFEDVDLSYDSVLREKLNQIRSKLI